MISADRMIPPDFEMAKSGLGSRVPSDSNGVALSNNCKSVYRAARRRIKKLDIKETGLLAGKA